MKKIKNSRVSFLGYLSFFLLVTFIFNCAVLTYSYIKDSVSGNGAIAGIMLLVIVILAAICTLFDLLRRKITEDRPVNMILDATDKIAHGDFGIELKPLHGYKNYDMYDSIMENINKMAKELSRNEVLKEDFISNVSHEIKTPLAVIENYAALICDENSGEEERAAYAKNILSATKRLTNLVTDILKLNKLENQIIREKKEEIRLGDFLGEIILSFEEAIDKKNISLAAI